MTFYNKLNFARQSFVVFLVLTHIFFASFIFVVTFVSFAWFYVLGEMVFYVL